jgi:CHAD domain-containing protein
MPEQRGGNLPTLRDHAGDTLERCYKRVLKRGRKIKSPNLRRLHRLRIATKKLRYAAGFFSPLYPRRRAQPMARTLNDLQDVLGAINDCASAPQMIEACARAARGPLRAAGAHHHRPLELGGARGAAARARRRLEGVRPGGALLALDLERNGDGPHFLGS